MLWLHVRMYLTGELAQLARAPDLHSGGHRFDSDILHQREKLRHVSVKQVT
jgi:hypothetical protein